jgi:hypothetical protein
MQSKLWRIVQGGLILGMVGWLAAGLLGCCGKWTQRDYGRSVTHNLVNSLVDPQAGQEVVVSRGQPPDAAVNAYSKYNKSFEPDKKKSLLKLTTED